MQYVRESLIELAQHMLHFLLADLAVPLDIQETEPKLQLLGNISVLLAKVKPSELQEVYGSTLSTVDRSKK